MIDSSYRSWYQKYFIMPLLRLPKIRSLSPNNITMLGLFFGLITPFFLSMHCPLFASLTLLVSGFLDTLDGSIARQSKQSSSFGAVLDITSDRVVEFCVIIGLYLYDPYARAWVSFLMFGSVFLCITTFLVVGIFSENSSEKSFYYSPGLIERTEAFAFWIAMILFPSLYVFLACLFSFLVLFTALFRLYQFAKRVA